MGEVIKVRLHGRHHPPPPSMEWAAGAWQLCRSLAAQLHQRVHAPAGGLSQGHGALCNAAGAVAGASRPPHRGPSGGSALPRSQAYCSRQAVLRCAAAPGRQLQGYIHHSVYTLALQFRLQPLLLHHGRRVVSAKEHGLKHQHGATCWRGLPWGVVGRRGRCRIPWARTVAGCPLGPRHPRWQPRTRAYIRHLGRMLAHSRAWSVDRVCVTRSQLAAPAAAEAP